MPCSQEAVQSFHAERVKQASNVRAVADASGGDAPQRVDDGFGTSLIIHAAEWQS